MKSFLKSPIFQLVSSSIVFVFIFAAVEKYAAGVLLYKILVFIPCFLFHTYCFDRIFKQHAKEAVIKERNRRKVEQMLADKASINMAELLTGAKVL